MKRLWISEDSRDGVHPIFSGTNVIAIAPEKAAAECIVKRSNVHDELVSALQGVVENWRPTPETSMHFERAKAALTLARGADEVPEAMALIWEAELVKNDNVVQL
jgi:hypothetical protein